MNYFNEKWVARFLAEAQAKAEWSHDPSKKIGAIAVTEDKRIIATGYNGFPRGIWDDPARYADRQTKYNYVVHAEKNLIYNAAKAGVSLEGAHVFVWGLPVCHECAKGLIQVGVSSILSVGEMNERWAESYKLSSDILWEVSLPYEHYTTYTDAIKHAQWPFLRYTRRNEISIYNDSPLGN